MSDDYDEKYTKPNLRRKLKAEIQAGSKGGKAGQWSARKSQMLVQAYEKHGGGYKQSHKDQDSRSLERWTEENWQTREGEGRARQDGTTKRYLPEQAWERLSEAEKARTDRNKQAASREGRQFVPNTEAAREARREATRPEHQTRATLYQRARELDIPNRSRMNKGELIQALREAGA